MLAYSITQSSGCSDRQMTTRFKSQIEQENLPLDKDWKKNLESHRVVDLLPDREAETAAQWMRHQPDLMVVSRDRGSEYAKAATLGAPQAIQCADRFHIVKNLTEATQQLLARCHAEITAASKTEETCQSELTKEVISIE